MEDCKIEVPFSDENSSLAIIKLLDKLTHSVMVVKVSLFKIWLC